jgi:hypothetical protein
MKKVTYILLRILAAILATSAAFQAIFSPQITNSILCLIASFLANINSELIERN